MARFSSLNNLVNCRMCGKLTHSDVDGCIGLDLCRPCYEEAGAENAHNDTHCGPESYKPECHWCQEEGRFFVEVEEDPKLTKALSALLDANLRAQTATEELAHTRRLLREAEQKLASIGHLAKVLPLVML